MAKGFMSLFLKEEKEDSKIKSDFDVTSQNTKPSNVESPVDQASPSVLDQSVHLNDPEVEKSTQQDSSYRGGYRAEIADMINEDLAERIDDEVAKYNYLAFKNAINGMGNMSAKQKFSAIFATLKPMGIEPIDVIAECERALSALEDTKREFESNSEAARQEKIVVKEQHIVEKNDEIKKLRDEISRLEQRIQGVQEEIESLSDEVNQAKHKIEITDANYVATHEQIVKAVQKDLHDLKEYASPQQTTENEQVTNQQ